MIFLFLNIKKKEKLQSFNNISRQLENEFMLISNYQKTNNKYLVEIHKKFTLAFACLLFAMTGAPLGILVRKRGGNFDCIRIKYCILSCVLYFINMGRAISR
ncbi:MAG: hypothetical protein Ct9H300mP18_01190 [Candidatus Neomarinimicrobiota bacterium]|nr:MAG: hypothetical protein Ct9H300mP18_01190 [Candidatus Neomarinimicrobiota bacterium]